LIIQPAGSAIGALAEKRSGKSHADWWKTLLFILLFIVLQVAVKLLD
jgi:hypothetical protein